MESLIGKHNDLSQIFKEKLKEIDYLREESKNIHAEKKFLGNYFVSLG